MFRYENVHKKIATSLFVFSAIFLTLSILVKSLSTYTIIGMFLSLLLLFIISIYHWATDRHIKLSTKLFYIFRLAIIIGLVSYGLIVWLIES